MNAKELRRIAKSCMHDAKKNRDNTEKAVAHFVDGLEELAKKGLFVKKTTCLTLLRQVTYFCQTDTGGDGFDIFCIDSVIDELKTLGFDVRFVKRSYGYSSLDIYWE